ncbi:MAG TPA: tRNA (guanosine(46)-N7)-methyltransferase TrmB [Cytophagaceae bacterium]
MGRQKLARFAVNAERRNVIQPGKEIYENIKGKWGEFFGNNNPIVLEVGCGRGEYTTGLAQAIPGKNFVGVDIKGSRIWKGSTVAYENNLLNAAFLRIYIQNIEDFFTNGEVSEVWITFPDPRPKDRDEKRRLTSPRFLQMYYNLMGGKGIINLKTDNKGLYEYTMEVLKTPPFKIKNLIHTDDLYNSEFLSYHYNIQTTYEKKFLQKGMNIHYIRFEIAGE